MRVKQQSISKLEQSDEIEEKKFEAILKAMECSDKELEWIKKYPPRKIAD